MTKQVAKIHMEDLGVAQQIDPLVDNFNEVVKVPILQGRLLEDVSVKEGAVTRVRHGLGRKLRGWIAVRSNIITGYLSDDQINNNKADEELWIFLQTGSTSATFKVSLWVF